MTLKRSIFTRIAYLKEKNLIPWWFICLQSKLLTGYGKYLGSVHFLSTSSSAITATINCYSEIWRREKRRKTVDDMIVDGGSVGHGVQSALKHKVLSWDYDVIVNSDPLFFSFTFSNDKILEEKLFNPLYLTRLPTRSSHAASSTSTAAWYRTSTRSLPEPIVTPLGGEHVFCIFVMSRAIWIHRLARTTSTQVDASFSSPSSPLEQEGHKLELWNEWDNPFWIEYQWKVGL